MVTFVCGMPCVGKSTFIKNNFNDIETMDIFDYQNKHGFCSTVDVLKGYEQAKIDLVKKALQGDIVIEHTLLKKIRRLEQIKNLRDNGYVGEIHLIFINPPKSIHSKRLLMRDFKKHEIDDFRKMHLDIMELPEENDNEGFDSILIVEE